MIELFIFIGCLISIAWLVCLLAIIAFIVQIIRLDVSINREKEIEDNEY